MKEIVINYNGKDELVQFDDKLSAGDYFYACQSALKGIKTNGMPDIDYREYAIHILTKCIKKAPFEITSQGLMSLDFITFTKLSSEIVSKHYPLWYFLQYLISVLSGEEVKMQGSQAESIGSVQKDLGGQ